MEACYDNENNSEVFNLLVELERMNLAFELLKEQFHNNWRPIIGLISTIYSAREYGEERPETFCVEPKVQNVKVDQKLETKDDNKQVILLV